jgi:phytoene dehydrogenase-like protein
VADTDVVIVGAGLAGLCCGRRLAQCGIPFRILEASDGVGGRVRSDHVDGFTLDRGFQIYLTAYPEGRRILDLNALDLRAFSRGAMVRYGGRFHHIYDPRFAPLAAVASLCNPIGTPADKLRMARLKWAIDCGSIEQQLAKNECLTADLLRWSGGFSIAMIDRLFRPFLGGVFLERDLKTSSRFFRFVFRMFATGLGAVPAAGMQAIPDQILNRLPTGSLRLHAKVEKIERGEIILASGESLRCRAVVLATEATEASRLTAGEVSCPEWNGTVTLYYAAGESPIRQPIIVLNGEGQGPVNNLAVMSDVAPSYAPPGQSLIAASIVGVPTDNDATLDRQVREQIAEWFGSSVTGWRLLRTYRIPQALPDQTPGRLDPWQRPVRLRPGLYVCGDHRDNASIDGAMTSGFRTAQAIMEDVTSGQI